MQLHATVERPSFRPSACLSVCPVRAPHAAAAGLLLWARRADVDRWQRAPQQHGARHSSGVRLANCARQRMRAVSRLQPA